VGLALILGNHACLEGDVLPYYPTGEWLTQIEEGLSVQLHDFGNETCFSARCACLDYTMLDALGESRPEFSLGECSQELRIHHYHWWLVEGTNQVLASSMVNAGLAADTAVYH